jgi:hypothetical protein
MALSANEVRTFAAGAGEFFDSLPVEGSAHIYEGSAVGDNGSGFAQPLEAADPFRGFAYREVDNSSGSDGDKRVKVRTRGEVKLSVATVADEDDVGETVYASDDGTFTLASTGNTAIGKVSQHISGTTCMVYFESAVVQSL